MRIFKYAAIAAAVVLSLAAGGIFAAGRVIDSKSDAILARIESRVPGLQLKNRFTSSSLLSRSGRLFYNYEKKGSKILGQPYVRGAVDYQVRVSLDGVDGTFSKAQDYGNLEDFTRPLQLSPINFTGKFRLNPYTLSLNAQVRLDPLSMSVPDGSCSLTESFLDLSAGTAAILESTFSSAALNCTSPIRYNNLPAYTAQLSGLRVSAAPSLKKLSDFSEVRIAFSKLILDGSTLYLIGFHPDQQVKDPSLRESFSITDADYVLSFMDRDSQGFGVLRAAGSGSYCMGNSVRENTPQEIFDLSHTSIDISVGKINPHKLKDLLAKGGSSLSLESLLEVVSKNVTMDIKKLYLEHASGKFDMSGSARTTMGEKGPEKINAGFNLTADEALIRSLLEEQYQHLLADAVEKGAVTFSSGTYKTRLEVKDGGGITFNGIRLQGGMDDTDEIEVTEDTEDSDSAEGDGEQQDRADAVQAAG